MRRLFQSLVVRGTTLIFHIIHGTIFFCSEACLHLSVPCLISVVLCKTPLSRGCTKFRNDLRYLYVCYFKLMQILVTFFCWDGVFLETFSLICSHHQYRSRVTMFYVYWALMAIEQWNQFSFLHLLWHRKYVDNGHIRWSVTLKPVAELLAGKL